jgi:hypothetical protein
LFELFECLAEQIQIGALALINLAAVCDS